MDQFMKDMFIYVILGKILQVIAKLGSSSMSEPYSHFLQPQTQPFKKGQRIRFKHLNWKTSNCSQLI